MPRFSFGANRTILLQGMSTKVSIYLIQRLLNKDCDWFRILMASFDVIYGFIFAAHDSVIPEGTEKKSR